MAQENSPLAGFAWTILQGIVLLSCLATMASFFARWWWACELAGHFRVPWFISLAIGTLILLLGKRRKLASIAGILAVVNLAFIAPLYFGGDRPISNDPSLRLLVLNVLTANRQHQNVLDLIEKTDPDVIILSEVNQRWIDALRPLDDRYPFARKLPREHNFGMAMFSRREFGQVDTVLLDDQLPAILARMQIQGQQLTIIGAHVLPPLGRIRAAARNRQLAQLAEAAVSAPGEVVLAGDLNTTSWSPFFQDLLTDSRLRDSRRGFGVQATWSGLSAIFRIPIDHCLVSSQLIVDDRRVIPVDGTDHHAVIIDLSVKNR